MGMNDGKRHQYLSQVYRKLYTLLPASKSCGAFEGYTSP